MVTVSVSVNPPLEPLVGWLRQFNIRSRNIRPVWPEIRGRFHGVARVQFANEGVFPGGFLSKWAALKPSYKAWKDKHYPGKRILHLTGEMRLAFIGRSPYGSWADTNNSTTLSVTKTVPGRKLWNLAALHDTGTAKMAKRRPFMVDSTIMPKFVEPIVDYLVGEKPLGTSKPFP